MLQLSVFWTLPIVPFLHSSKSRAMDNAKKANKINNTPSSPEAYLYKMTPVVRIRIAPPLKYLKLCLLIINL
jgi:hypothetical protein